MRPPWTLLAAGAALLLAGASAVGPAPPDTLVYLMEGDVEGLDPHTSGELAQTRALMANLYESLLTTDDAMALRPALALSWSNPDDRTWDFRLRSGVRFHGGGTLGAADVVASLERARSDPRSVLRSVLGSVTRIVAFGGDAVRVETREPDAFLPSGLVDVPVVSRACLAPGGGFPADASCGTGPYRLVARVVGRTVELARFDGWWGGRAAVPKVRFVARSINEGDAFSFVPPTGRLVFGGTYPPATEKRLRRLFSRHVTAGLSTAYLGFDLTSDTPEGVRLPPGRRGNPFRDRDVRRAIALAVGTVFDPSVGEGAAPSQPVPPLVFGFDPSLPTRVVDRDAARRSLAESGYPEGFGVDLHVRNVMKGFAAPVAADLAAIGIDARPALAPDEAFFAHLASGGASLYVLRFSCRSGDAQEFLDKWAHSRDAARGFGEFNYSYDRSPVPGLDTLIEEARHELRLPQRKEKLQAALRVVTGEALLVPLLWHRNIHYASRDVAFDPRADNLLLASGVRFLR